MTHDVEKLPKTSSERGRQLRAILEDISDQHEERMKSDPRYRQTVAIMQDATKTIEPTRHYDRDGYCDNPARGY